MRLRWDATRDQQLRDAYRQRCPHGPAKLSRAEWDAIGAALGTSGKAAGIQASRLGLTKGMEPQSDAVRSREGAAVPSVPQGQANGLGGFAGARGDTPSGSIPDGREGSSPSPTLHVKKLHVHVPPAVTPASSNGLLTAVLYGDAHFPFQDDAALRVVAQVIRVAKPDVLIDVGDGMDAYHLSRFDKNPTRVHTLQDEIDQYRAHLAAFRVLAPNADFYVMEGNHPDRLRRMLWNMPEQVKALSQLRAFTEALTWPKLLGLDDLGITFIPYGEETKHRLLPKFIVKHGSVVRKLSGYTARAELDKYNTSGASGHTHRLGQFFHRDLNGNHVWLETGCTCKLNPEYAQDPDWQQGCVVMTFEPTTGAFQAETIYIHDGSAVFRGKWYDTRGEG